MLFFLSRSFTNSHGLIPAGAAVTRTAFALHQYIVCIEAIACSFLAKHRQYSLGETLLQGLERGEVAHKLYIDE